MAEGTFKREDTGNPLASSDLGNAPRTRTALSGIRTGQGQVETNTNLQDNVSKLQQGIAKRRQRQESEDFVSGQLAAATGETQDELRNRGGSRHEMAGLVSVELGNQMQAWHQQQLNEASVKWTERTPDEYREYLSKQTATIAAEVGDDPYAQRIATGLLTKSAQQLAQTHTIRHQQFVEDGIATEYGYGLSLSAQTASQVVSSTSVDPVSHAGYQTYAESVVDHFISAESGGDPSARTKVAGQTAGGLGGFTDGTWLAVVSAHRPDLTQGRSRAEIIALKFNGPLSREMTIAHTRDNAAVLARKGIEVTPRNSYLTHFAGVGGGPRVIQGDRNAHVSSVLTSQQINANAFLKDWTVGRLQDWAAKKAGQSTTPLKDQVLSNPGLPPERHKNEVLNAMLDGLKSDDPSLYEASGGAATLRELGASNAQIASVDGAYRAYKDRELSAYSLDYERRADEIVNLAETGELSEDEIYERLDSFQKSYPRTDVEQRRLFNEVAEQMDDRDGTGWQSPDGLAYILDAREAAKEATSTDEVRSILQEVVDEGNLRGISAEDTAKQTVAMASAFERAQDARKSEIRRKAAGTRQEQEIYSEARLRLGNGTLKSGSASVQKAGVAMLRKTVAEGVQARVDSGDLDINKRNSVVIQEYAHELVQSNAVDTELASTMAAAVTDVRGWDLGGELPDEAIRAYATYLEFRRGGQATDGYLNRMFKDNPDSLAFFRTAESLDTGSADTETSIRTAARLRTEPERMEMAQRKQQELNDAGFLEDAVSDFSKQAGVTKGWGGLFDDRASASDRNRLKSDPKLRRYIEDASRIQIALIPGISTKAARAHAVGQALENGAPILGNFVAAPSGTTLYEIAGVSSATGPSVISDIVSYGMQNAFPTLPESARDSILLGIRSSSIMSRVASGMMAPGTRDDITPGELSSANWDMHATTIDGDVILRIVPTKAMIDTWGRNEQDTAALQTPMIISLSSAGAAFKAKKLEPTTTDSALNSLADLFRSDK